MISGLQKMTLLDYPGKVACTVFLQGCNFRCPFCHNSDLLGKEGPETIEVETLLTFLKKRVGLLDAVCITGGEPTLQPGLEDLIVRIKEMGYLVKLDTNGGRPEVLKTLVEKGLIDYVAMDIKNSPEKYGITAGVPGMTLDRVEESIKFLLAGNVPYEFRTTVAAQFHDEESFEDIARWIAGAKRYALQEFKDSGDILTGGLTPCTQEQMEGFLSILKPLVPGAFLRGNE